MAAMSRGSRRGGALADAPFQFHGCCVKPPLLLPAFLPVLLPVSLPASLLAALLLAACGPAAAPDAEPTRIALEDTRPQQARAFASPDTSEAFWRVAGDGPEDDPEAGKAIRFGNAGEAALLTLACDLPRDLPPDLPPELSGKLSGDVSSPRSAPHLRIIRHTEALPGQSALFPFIGNGMTSRFLADTVLVDGEWRWEARLPADDPKLEIFAGNRDMTATLPGRGMLTFRGSRIPGEFLTWCRAGGRMPVVESDAGQDGEAAPGSADQDVSQ